MNKKEISPQMVLCEFGCMGRLNFVSSTDYVFNKIANMMNSYYKLEYFKELDGVKDVIRYSKITKDNNDIISYYTIRDNGVIIGSMVDDEIDWSYTIGNGIFNFVLTRFKAFKDMGIAFSYDELNQITDDYNNKNNQNKLCRVLINQKNR